MLTVTSYSSDCCVLSGLDFEAASDSVVRYFVSNFASRASSRCKHDVGTLSWLNAETVKRAPTPLFGRLVRCSTHGPFFARLWYMYQSCSMQKSLFVFELLLELLLSSGKVVSVPPLCCSVGIRMEPLSASFSVTAATTPRWVLGVATPT